MATLGTCGYCSKPAAITCRMCGTPICQDHVDDDAAQVCASCARGNVMGQANS